MSIVPPYIHKEALEIPEPPSRAEPDRYDPSMANGAYVRFASQALGSIETTEIEPGVFEHKLSPEQN